MAAHLTWLNNELVVLRDFGLGFALCHHDFAATREAIKREQEKVGKLIDAKPETSLARLIAEKQAEALETLEKLLDEEADKYDMNVRYQTGFRAAVRKVENRKNELRRQAEESE